jgi:hypothetical protein
MILIKYLLLCITAFYFSGINYSAGDQYFIDIAKSYNSAKSINLSSVGKKITFIPLESDPKCLIQKVRKVELSESFIFVKDYNKLYLFDRSGKFLRQIGAEGRGPAEQTFLMNFCVDESRKEIYVISLPGKLDVFSLSGDHIKSTELNFMPSQVMIKDENSLIYLIWDQPGKDDPGWIITDRRGKLEASIMRIQKRVAAPGFGVAMTPFYSYKGKIHLMEFANDTLFSLEKNKKVHYIKFSFGGSKMDPDPVMTTGPKRNLFTDRLWVQTILENEKFIFLHLKTGITSGFRNVLFNKLTNETTFIKDDKLKNDISGNADFWPEQITDDGVLVDYVDSFVLLQGILPSQLRGKITETSNPVLILLHTDDYESNN